MYPSKNFSFVGLVIALVVLLTIPATAFQMDPAAKADVTGDGIVNILDLSTMGSRFGLQAGQAGYRGGLDLDPNGEIGMPDFMEVLSRFGTIGAPTTGTIFRGTVFDGLGNRLQGVEVTLESGVAGCTDRNGAYAIPVEPSDFRENHVTFHGPTFDPVTGASANSCDASAVDPTPNFLSGQYPTIPNKPVYINAGIDNVFRAVPLPERDLTNAQDLRDTGVATNVGGNAWRLDQKVEVINAGVKLGVPAGCTVTFPAGEDPVLSITRVPPDRLPVPMPPGLSSTLFVTYQPGATEIDCPAGTDLFTEFDNDDGFPVGPGNLTDGPFLAGITNGVFTPLVACEVLVGGATVRCGPIPQPFDFAWYHTDIRPTPPCIENSPQVRCICPRTILTGFVVDDILALGVVGANVSTPGAVPVFTDANGNFTIPNIPAGPNGFNCFSNPFSKRAAAFKDLSGNGALESEEFGVSPLVMAFPGGQTDVGDIPLGLQGGAVQGRVLKLGSIAPFIVTPLPGADVTVFPSASPGFNTDTDDSGNYNFPDLPQGQCVIEARFEGDLPEPGGGTVLKRFFGEQDCEIEFGGDIEVKDFLFTGTGAVQVTVLDPNGVPVPFVGVNLNALGGSLGSGFVAPAVGCFESTDVNGIATFSSSSSFSGSCFNNATESEMGVPMGPCEVSVQGLNIVNVNGNDGNGCFVNQHGELVELEVEVQSPGDIDNVQVTQGLSKGVDQIFVEVEFSTPFSLSECFDIFFKLEFDTDQDPATGADSLISEISNIAHGPTNLGVELILECDPVCRLELPDGTEVYADTSSFGCVNRPEGDVTTVSIGIRKDEFVAAAGGAGTYDMALLSRFGGVFVGNVLFDLGIHDVVPNGGSVAVDSEGSGQLFTDDLGDTFEVAPF